MSNDALTLFRNAVDNCVKYPAQDTVIRTAMFAHALDAFLRRLKEKDVFREGKPSLGFMDLYEGSQGRPLETRLFPEKSKLTLRIYSILSNPRYRYGEKA